MAYDAMGNYTGEDYETEEERRRRLAAEQANAVVQSTMVKTYGDGTKEETTKRTVAGPVSPDQVFQRQIQAESGGQHYAPGGGLLTSPAGAQGVAQIMPATAAAPGYGIKPATPEEIATPEGNRAFGERYKAGMLNLFGGDQQKATAAYNAGPGRIQQAERQAAEQGGNWTDYIPKETMGYLGKVFGNIIPSAQAATPPVQTPQQQEQTRLGYMHQQAIDQGMAASSPPAAERPLPPGIVRDADGTLRMTAMPQAQAPAVQAQAQAPAVDPYMQQYNQNQDDIIPLVALTKDANAPEAVRRLASERAAELNQQNYQRQQAEAKVKEMNPVQISNELRKKGEEGSWVKAILFGLLGMENSQKEEAAKLGIGKWEDTTLTTADGKEIGVQLKRAPNGQILKGVTHTGQELTPEEISAAQAGTLAKGVHVTRVDNMIDPKNPDKIITKQVLSNGKEKFLSGGTAYTGDKSSLQMAQQFTEQENRRVNQAYSNLAKNYANPTQQQKAEALRDAGVSIYRIESELGVAPGSLGTGKGRLTAGGGAPASVPPGTTPDRMSPRQAVAVLENPTERPTQREGESNKVFDTRLKEWETKNKLQTKAAEAFNEKRFEIRSTLDKFKQGIEVIDSGNHNLGPNFSTKGAGPLPKVQQFFGEQFGTDDAQNTNLLRSLITRDGLNGIKNSMGPAISNFDVETWMRSNPIKENSSPEAIKAWLQKTYTAMYDSAEAQRKNAERLGFIEPGFTLGGPVTGGAGSAANNMSPADMARAELERRRRGQ